MNLGILLPGFSSHENDWAIPVQLNLVRELAKHDDVRVLALRYPHRRDCYRIGAATVHSLGAGQARGLRRLALWLDALRTLRKLHREKPFGVLHAMWADETGLLAAWAGRWLGIPSVVSIAGGELARLPDYGLQRSAFSRWIVGQALRADAVLPACSYTRDLILEVGYRVPEVNIRIISLGVDADRFSPSPGKTQPNRLLHVASLLSVKDQPTLLRALAHLDSKFVLDVVGVGPEESRLRALAAQLGISDRVNFFGEVPHLQLPEYYRHAALHVLPSRHEGFGMVTVEAAACGVPTIGTAVGILPDVPELGVAVPVGDEVAMAGAIRSLLTDEARRQALGRAARRAVEERFTVQRTAEHLRSLYRELNSRAKLG
jgi:glycosyltransferase involved in cell wall biosynthesis